MYDGISFNKVYPIGKNKLTPPKQIKHQLTEHFFNNRLIGY